jgi:Na+/melibiose symporter-like transporter
MNQRKFSRLEFVMGVLSLLLNIVGLVLFFVSYTTGYYKFGEMNSPMILSFFLVGIGMEIFSLLAMVKWGDKMWTRFLTFAITALLVAGAILLIGDRVEGTVYAMASFVRKMAGAVCTGIGGWALTWIGYNELAVTQTEEVRQALFNIIVGLPLLCFALTLIFMLFYPLNKKRVEENEKKMEALRSKEQA